MRNGALSSLVLIPVTLALALIAVAASPPALAAGPGLRSATLSLSPANALVDLGGSSVVDIRVDGVSDLFGYQFIVAYDASKVGASAAFVNTFFDTTSNAEIVWNATCDAGVCSFAVSRKRPAEAVSGSGVLAQITFTGLSGGMSPLTISSDMLADRDGLPIAHTASNGLITVCSGGPLLQMSPATSKIAIGESTTIVINALCLANFYGYQFEVLYDATTLSAVGAFSNDFFDTTSDGSVPPGWNATCADGVCRFGATKVNPAPPLTGSGPLANITFTGLHAGVVPLAFNVDLLADRDGTAIAHTATGASITVYGYATINGTVILQGRFTGPVDPGTVTFSEATSTYPPVTVPFDGATGSYSALVPCDPGGMTYTALAEHDLYLSNLRSGQLLQPEQTYPFPTTTLLAGDANNDDIVDILDLSCIGGDFYQPPDVCGTTGWTDINADGYVDLLDLTLTGGNFYRTSPQFSW